MQNSAHFSLIQLSSFGSRAPCCHDGTKISEFLPNSLPARKQSISENFALFQPTSLNDFRKNSVEFMPDFLQSLQYSRLESHNQSINCKPVSEFESFTSFQAIEGDSLNEDEGYLILDEEFGKLKLNPGDQLEADSEKENKRKYQKCLYWGNLSLNFHGMEFQKSVRIMEQSEKNKIILLIKAVPKFAEYFRLTNLQYSRLKAHFHLCSEVVEKWNKDEQEWVEEFCIHIKLMDKLQSGVPSNKQ